MSQSNWIPVYKMPDSEELTFLCTEIQCLRSEAQKIGEKTAAMMQWKLVAIKPVVITVN